MLPFCSAWPGTLPVQHKNSRDPGDNQAMVEARRDFLNAGHYAPVAKRLAELAASYAPDRWVDIGCGEGYYTAQIAEALPNADGYALDISREAVKRACKRNPALTWLIASMARVPLASGSCQFLASVFSPLDWGRGQAPAQCRRRPDEGRPDQRPRCVVYCWPHAAQLPAKLPQQWLVEQNLTVQNEM